MYTPYTSKHFVKYVDPVSKVRIAVLSTRVAPIQQAFYFVNSCISDDGRYLWFYCCFPPADGKSLAVIDFLTDEIHHFPETRGSGWLVDPRTGNLFWGCKQGIYMRTPHPEDKPILVGRLPESCRKAGINYVATHLTFTADYKELLVDIRTYLGSVIGTMDIATGEFTQWYQTNADLEYNHAQMNPADKDVCMCASEYIFDPKVGDYVAPAMIDGIYPRLQIITRDGQTKMLKPCGNYATHEWWAPDGKSVFYCNSDYVENGERIGIVARDRLDGSDPSIMFRINIPGGSGTWHAHCTADEKYFVTDGAYPHGDLTWWRGCESMVHFCNIETGKIFRFLTKNPVVEGWSPENPSIYHIDAHPRFILGDSMISFTTTVYGRVDAAFVSVDQLIEATK